jgi:hypothetical protein
VTNASDSERLDIIEMELRALTQAVNAIARSQQPGRIAVALAAPVVWIATMGFLIGVVGFTIRTVNQVQSNTARIAAIEALVPISSRNSERIAGAIDNLCVGLSTSQRARGIQPITCGRTLIEPLTVRAP